MIHDFDLLVDVSLIVKPEILALNLDFDLYIDRLIRECIRYVRIMFIIVLESVVDQGFPAFSQLLTSKHFC